MDATPQEHSEYPTLVECYTKTKKGLVNSGQILSGNVGSSQALDLLTIAKHEIGHALGFSTWNNQWISKNAGEGIRLTSPRPFSEFVIPIDATGHLRLQGALMDPSLVPGQRKLLSVIDVLVIAEMGEFLNLNLNPGEYKAVTSFEDTGQTKMHCPTPLTPSSPSPVIQEWQSQPTTGSL